VTAQLGTLFTDEAGVIIYNCKMFIIEAVDEKDGKRPALN
jgi:hypothetical protein